MYGNTLCGYGFGPLFGPGPGLVVIVLLALVTLVMVWGRGRVTPRSSPAQAGAAALETLARRYAAGEISEEEYLSIKKNLGQ